MEKKEARREIRRRINALTPEERRAKSQAVRERVQSLPEMAQAACIMAFISMPDELDMRPILSDMLDAGKRVYLPRTFLEERRMAPVRLTSLDALREGAYGILEPDSDETCDVAEVDLIIVPARGFDRAGNRLGRGAGFYDRFMAQPGSRAVRCGVAFACQILPDVPHDTHDLPVSILVTEDEVLRVQAHLQG